MKKDVLKDSSVNIHSLQEKVKNQLTREFKKGTGAFFTPYKIIQRLIDLADVDLGDKIFDPSCALGQFLDALINILVLIGKKKRLQGLELAKLVSQNIYGTDINESFVRTCKRHLSNKAYELLGAKVKFKISKKDFLSLDSKEQFDIVIGNPPYGIPGYDPHYPIRFSQEQKRDYKKRFKTWRGKYNIYALFIEQSLNVLKIGGRLSFIVPATFMILNEFEKLRKHLSKTGKIEIDYLGSGIFKDAQVATVLLKVTKGKKGIILKANDYYNEKELYQGDLIRFEDDFTKDLEKNALCRLDDLFDIHISARSPEVANNPFVSRTLHSEQRRGWSSKKSDSIDEPNLSVPGKLLEGYLPILNGRNLKPFKIDYETNFSGYWIKSDKVGTLKDFYLKDRIAVGHTKGGKIEAAVDYRKYPWISDVYFLIPNENLLSLIRNDKLKPLSLEEITYLLNSSLAQKFMRSLYKDITPHTTLTQLKIFPIYPINQWEKLEEKYEKDK